MVNFLNIQFSLFGPFNVIKPDSKNIMEIMQRMGSYNLIPNIVTIQNIDLNTRKLNLDQRISFSSNDSVYNFVILNERIDFNYTPIEVVSQKEEQLLDNVHEFSSDMLKVISDVFDIKGNRLALNINILGNVDIKDKLTEVYTKRIIPLSYYSDKEIVEWSCSNNARTKLSINNKDELVNVITNLSIASNNNSVTEEKRSICHLDINTNFEDMTNRFSLIEFNEFYEEVKIIVIELINNFNEGEKDD